MAVVAGLLAGMPASLHASDLWQSAAGSTPDGEAASAKSTSDDGAYRQALERGERNAVLAMKIYEDRFFNRTRQTRAYLAVVERAIESYEHASKLRPTAAEPHYRVAEVIHRHYLDGLQSGPVIHDTALARRALEHWERFETLAPLDPRIMDTLDRRAIVYTKLSTPEDLERAIACYETILARSDLSTHDPRNVARWLANMAETYMMVGRLDEAITSYRDALDYSDEALYGYGLAVALDRDEMGELAREVMLSYAQTDDLRALSRSSVFFVPDGEKDYYLGLGYEVLADYPRAIQHYEAYVASGAHPRYQPRARENMRRIAARPHARPRKPRGPRF